MEHVLHYVKLIAQLLTVANATMKITNKVHCIDEFIIPSPLYVFRAMFSPIIRSTWLYLQ
jgi:hypothetical protein